MSIDFAGQTVKYRGNGCERLLIIVISALHAGHVGFTPPCVSILATVIRAVDTSPVIFGPPTNRLSS